MRAMVDSLSFVDLVAQYNSIGDEIGTAIDQVLLECDFIEGAKVGEFERAFAEFIGTKQAIGVASGYDSLNLAMQALDIGPGDEVIVPANSHVASAFPVTALGARPVLVDCTRQTYEMDTDAVAAALTRKTRAVMPVHFAGQSVDMGALMLMAEKHGLYVIEDTAQAHGARYKGRRCGSMGTVGCFSFYPGKNLGAYGDGGAVTTDSEPLATRIRRLKNFGQNVKYQHREIGRNARLDTLQAAVLLVKLKYLDSWNAARAKHAYRYRELLTDVGDLSLQQTVVGAEHVYHLFIIETDQRDALQQHLHGDGINTVIHYPTPIHLQEAYRSLGYRRGSFPNAESLANRTLSLPMFPELSEQQIERVASSIKAFFRK